MSTFSVWPWTDAYNPGEPGGGRRAAALAADSATLHRLPVRRSYASCGLLQTNLYTPQKKAGPVKGGVELEIKVAHSAHDWRRAKEALGREHGLGAGREAGDRLCQLVFEEGRLAAVLVWCAAAWHLKGRVDAVGWDAVTRSERLKLVVQLRRFLVLEQARRPNLASQCLGLGWRELAGQWEGTHGYRPLLAESFSDPESHAGTVYKVTNWELAGVT